MLLEGDGAALTAAVPLEVADDPCTVLLSSAGLLARTTRGPGEDAPAGDSEPEQAGRDRARRDHRRIGGPPPRAARSAW